SWRVVSDAVVQGELEGWRAVGALCADGADRLAIRQRPSRQLGARSPQSRFRQYAVYPLGTDATACRSRRRLLCDLRHDPSHCDFVSAADTAATSAVRCSICRALQFRSRCLYCATPRAIPIARSPARLTLGRCWPLTLPRSGVGDACRIEGAALSRFDVPRQHDRRWTGHLAIPCITCRGEASCLFVLAAQVIIQLVYYGRGCWPASRCW